MKNILIGSRALDYWLSVGIVKDSTDYDIISAKPIEGAEFHNVLHLNNYSFDEFTDSNHKMDFNGEIIHIMTLQGLAIIKRSHLWRNLAFNKHIAHYHKYLKPYINLDHPVLKKRIEMTKNMYPQQGPNLKLSKDDFFDDAVVKKHSHDYLHELYANEDKPMYTKLQKKDHEIYCYKELWDNLSQNQKILCVQEEANVLATERFLVPSAFKYNTKLAYFKAVEKICTTVTKGYFRSFAIDYYPEVLSKFDEGKFLEVKEKLSKLDKQ